MRGKKYFLYIISLLLAINFAACKTDNKKQSAGKEIEKSFDIKAAENIVNSYMNYLMKEDYQNVSRFYSKEISKNIPKINKQPLKIRGYNIIEINEIGKSGLFRIKVARMNMSEPYASLEEYILKVIKEDTDYKISDVNTSIDKEAFLKNGRLRIRSKNNVDTNLLIDPGGIPNYAFSKDDKAKTDKIEVSKKNYGPMIFSYSGYSIAISTYEKDSFAGIIKIDESMAVQGGQKDDQSQQGGSTGGEKGATGLVKEKPVGKEFTALDLLKNSKIDYMVFSGDEKFLLIQYSKDGYGKSIGLYHSEGGEMIPYEFEKNYPIDKVDIIFSSFDKEALNFEVVPRAGADKSVGEYIGRWRMDLKEFRVKKM
ncbi:hypothetical protein CLLI_16680 [Clostridium liquoris]|uniref:Head-tail adaptor protein n=1 Tax=Clostridium liquoris TaxID=1289519 RepID=A0A2T0B3E3_9CLOT|nr:hypothetical protein [Clostridium liquoris]PRR78409.1 hypothetical protein CLLI_16680 [Clostridium liquoris]